MEIYTTSLNGAPVAIGQAGNLVSPPLFLTISAQSINYYLWYAFMMTEDNTSGLVFYETNISKTQYANQGDIESDPLWTKLNIW